METWKFDDTTEGIALQPADLEVWLPKRDPKGNKGTFGKVAVIAGSKDICGAALLAAEAAYRSGCGMVMLVTHEKNRTPACVRLPEAMLATYETEEEAKACVEKALAWADVLLVGPGIGTDEIAKTLVSEALSSDLPIVLDADGINVYSGARFPIHNSNLILTPHMKEMERLTGVPVKELKAAPQRYATKLAKELTTETTKAVCVLKDARTLIATAEDPVAVHQGGTDGMATGGSGDVLAGIIAGLYAQLRKEQDAARRAAVAGVYLHGLAGMAAEQSIGSYGMLAGDILKGIDVAIRHGKEDVAGEDLAHTDM